MARREKTQITQDLVDELVQIHGPVPLLEMIADACYAVADRADDRDGTEGADSRAFTRQWRDAADEICHIYQEMSFLQSNVKMAL